MISEFSSKVGIPVEEIIGRSRERMAVDARHLYWRLLRDKKNFTVTVIARLNERTHATVVHGLKKADDLLETGDAYTVKMWDKIKDIL